MARPRGFDEDAALQRAMELFWARGYQATSTADLVEHLGIGRASLYATFGSKHDLFLRSLERYVEARKSAILAMLSQPGPALPAVRDVVNLFATRASNTAQRGCFVVNTTAELLPDDELAARQVQSTWTALETALGSALIRAQAQGEIAKERDPRALASLLVILIQGFLISGKADPSPTRLQNAARQALSILD